MKRLLDSARPRIQAPSKSSPIGNASELMAYKFARCGYCIVQCRTDSVTEYIHDEGTALCPGCGVDALLAGANVNQARDYWRKNFREDTR